MTKIFITIPWFLPAFRAGGPVQSVANLVREFHEGVAYFIFCGDVDVNGAALEGIQTNQWVPFNEQTKVWYNGPEKISDTLVKQVELEKPDILYIIGLFSWHFNIVPMMFCKGPKKILSTRGMLHPGALSQKKWKKKIYLQLFKLLQFHYKVIFHATDAGEGDYIRNYFGEPANVMVAANFPNEIPFLPVEKKVRGHLKLISIALISRMKNILKVLEALEKVACRIEYELYGTIKDEEYWKACKEQIKKLPANITVNFHKEIEPSKVKEALEKAHVFILPSESENFGHAIFEALSAGRPVVTSHHTPWSHLKESGVGINVSIENNDELVGAIEFFAAMGAEEMEAWSMAAHHYAGKAVDREKIKEEYKRMFGLG